MRIILQHKTGGGEEEMREGIVCSICLSNNFLQGEGEGAVYSIYLFSDVNSLTMANFKLPT